ncbi:hypothetical protein BU16DRAFT_72724 [Lophium mytilinum]|uniref:Uncharacterized protein n=1 Tax=Lophium mytilinum TaxID=390894 RepID=A0A6A6QLK1_9PEZI|nr:hypothetical protein BU16DRAFT_72724 [Lophium mytilinum]
MVVIVAERAREEGWYYQGLGAGRARTRDSQLSHQCWSPIQKETGRPFVAYGGDNAAQLEPTTRRVSGLAMGGQDSGWCKGWRCFCCRNETVRGCGGSICGDQSRDSPRVTLGWPPECWSIPRSIPRSIPSAWFPRRFALGRHPVRSNDAISTPILRLHCLPDSVSGAVPSMPNVGGGLGVGVCGRYARNLTG